MSMGSMMLLMIGLFTNVMSVVGLTSTKVDMNKIDDLRGDYHEIKMY